jgi:hypothetical protein
VECGGVFAEVLAEPAGPQHYVKKHPGPPKYEDFLIHVGLSASKRLLDWIAASWTAHSSTEDGAILALDSAFKIKNERTFSKALVTETIVPALDASSKETGFLTVRLTPQSIALKKGAGALALSKALQQKLWRTANFRLEIDGLDCTKVSRIDSFAVKRAAGGGKIDFPSLRIRVAEAAAQSWVGWHGDFVVKGYNTDAFERHGWLRFLSTNLKTELARIELGNLGIVSLAPEKSEGGALGRLVAEIYCEQMALSLAGSPA